VAQKLCKMTDIFLNVLRAWNVARKCPSLQKKKKLLDVIHSLEVILHFNCNFLGWFSGMMPKFFFIISYVHFKLHNQTDFM
jgi:hypothetical protein